MVKEQRPQQSTLTLASQQPILSSTSGQLNSYLSLRDNRSINFTNGKLGIKQLELLQKEQELEAEDIKLYGNRLPSTINAVAFLSLPRIKTLYLSGNNITSIEPLQFLNAPALEVLSLKSNFILSIKPLRKMNLSNLQQLWLNDNCIVDYSPLSQVRTASEGIMLGLDALSESAVGYESRGLIRMQFKTLRHLQTSKKFRIVDSKLQKVLAERFSKRN